MGRKYGAAAMRLPSFLLSSALRRVVVLLPNLLALRARNSNKR